MYCYSLENTEALHYKTEAALGALALINAARRDAVDTPALNRLLTNVVLVQPGGGFGGHSLSRLQDL